MISEVYAMAQAPSTAPNSPPSLLQSPFVPLIGLFIILYFMMLRPQKKREQQHKKYLDALKKGDEVITLSGMFGRVAGVTEQVVTLDVGNNLKIRVTKATIAGPQPANLASEGNG